MQPVFGLRLSDHYRYLPCIVAELANDLSFPENGGRVHHERGARAYLILRGENPLLEPDVEVYLRTVLSNLRLREVKWSDLRFAEIMDVPSKIGERCWRSTPDQMQSMLTAIRGKIQGSEVVPVDFSVPLDDL